MTHSAYEIFFFSIFMIILIEYVFPPFIKNINKNGSPKKTELDHCAAQLENLKEEYYNLKEAYKQQKHKFYNKKEALNEIMEFVAEYAKEAEKNRNEEILNLAKIKCSNAYTHARNRAIQNLCQQKIDELKQNPTILKDEIIKTIKHCKL